MSTLLESARTLNQLALAPHQLVPDCFNAHIGSLEVTPFAGWVGNLDEGFEADIALLISGRFPIIQTEEGDRFYEALTRRHRLLLKKGQVADNSNPAFLFIAHELHPQSQIRGVDVLTTILHPSLRGNGLGKAFSDRFNQMVWEAGYSFTYGDNRETRYLSSFVKNGSIPTEALREETTMHDSPIYLGIPRSPKQTIRFNPNQGLQAMFLQTG